LQGADFIERDADLLGVHRTMRDIRDGVIPINRGNTASLRPGAITTMEEQLREFETGIERLATAYV